MAARRAARRADAYLFSRVATWFPKKLLTIYQLRMKFIVLLLFWYGKTAMKIHFAFVSSQSSHDVVQTLRSRLLWRRFTLMYLRNPHLRTRGPNPILSLGDSIDILPPARIKAPICFDLPAADWRCCRLTRLPTSNLPPSESVRIWSYPKGWRWVPSSLRINCVPESPSKFGFASSFFNEPCYKIDFHVL